MEYRNSVYPEGGFDLYLFETNLQGDVIGVYNELGEKIISYTYDAWGNCTMTASANVTAGSDFAAAFNPFRYRGYYYDTELGLYYLNARYYDPNTGRFISPDPKYISTGQGINGSNMYAYCLNNPVMMIDPAGKISCGAFSTLPVSLILPRLSYKRYLDWRNSYITSSSKANADLDANRQKGSYRKMILDQKTEMVSRYKYGLFSLSDNGCEIIAVHNLKVLLGMKSSLSETIEMFYETGAMIGTSGFFGSSPKRIGRVLEAYGIDYEIVKATDMTKEGRYIISYWNGIPYLSSLHTITVSYINGKYYAFNYGDEEFDPSSFGYRYITGYYITN